MKAELTTYGDVSLGLVVKKVKGRLYVYEQYKVGDKVITKYIAPLETLVRYYQLKKVVNDDALVNYRLTPRKLRMLAQELAKEVVNLMESNEKETPVLWWTGRDLNPGPLGCKPSALPS